MTMNNKRNIGITGSPNSGVSDVFAALVRFGIPPEKPSAVVMDSGNREHTDWGEYDIEDKQPPYDAKKRGKLFGGLSNGKS